MSAQPLCEIMSAAIRARAATTWRSGSKSFLRSSKVAPQSGRCRCSFVHIRSHCRRPRLLFATRRSSALITGIATDDPREQRGALRIALCAPGLAFALVPAQSRAQEVTASPTPSPPPPSPSPSKKKSRRSMKPRAAPQPHQSARTGSICRRRVTCISPKLPIVTSAPATAVTGARDLALYDLAVTDAPRNRLARGSDGSSPHRSKRLVGNRKILRRTCRPLSHSKRSLDAGLLPTIFFFGHWSQMPIVGRTVEDGARSRACASEAGASACRA